MNWQRPTCNSLLSGQTNLPPSQFLFHRTNGLISSKGFHMKHFVLPIIVFDIVIGPAGPIYSLPISTVLILYLSLIWFNINVTNKKIPYVLFTTTIIVSTVLSVLFKEGSYSIVFGEYFNAVTEDIKRCYYLFAGILLYRITWISFKQYQNKIDKKINTILICACILFDVFAYIFYYNIDLFYVIKSSFFSVNINLLEIQELKSAGYFRRYGFILLDPNNAGYYILIISIYLIVNANVSRLAKLFAWANAIIVPFLTHSIGVLTSLIIFMMFLLYNYLRATVSSQRRKTASLFFLFYLSGLGLLIVLLIQFEVIQLSSIAEMLGLNKRVLLYMEMPGSRLDKYIYLFNELPPIVGIGYTIIRESESFRPHSDHLRFLYAYGFLSYISIWAMLIERKMFRQKYLLLVPALMAFSINSLIDETRLLYTFIILIAIIGAKETSFEKQGGRTDAHNR